MQAVQFADSQSNKPLLFRPDQEGGRSLGRGGSRFNQLRHVSVLLCFTVDEYIYTLVIA